jgi:hypothetical protein
MLQQREKKVEVVLSSVQGTLCAVRVMSVWQPGSRMRLAEQLSAMMLDGELATNVQLQLASQE